MTGKNFSDWNRIGKRIALEKCISEKLNISQEKVKEILKQD